MSTKSPPKHSPAVQSPAEATRPTAPVRSEIVSRTEANEQPSAPNLLTDAERSQAQIVDRTVRDFALALDQAKGHMERTRLMGKAMAALESAITPEIMADIMPLMNSPNGFKTDRDGRDGKLYSVAEVKRCLITSLLHGFYPVNNEWNIIAGNLYGAKNGWMRKLEEVPGITDINCSPGRIVVQDGQTLVRVALSWKLHGVPNQLVDHEGKPGQVFTIQTRGGASPDNTIGKATAKAYRAAYRKATGSRWTLEDEPGLIEGKVLGTKTLPTGGDTPNQVSARLAENPTVKRQELLNQVRTLGAALGFQEPDWYEMAELLGVPGDLNACSSEQLGQWLTRLHQEKAQADREAEEERLSLQGQN